MLLSAGALGNADGRARLDAAGWLRVQHQAVSGYTCEKAERWARAARLLRAGCATRLRKEGGLPGARGVQCGAAHGSRSSNLVCFGLIQADVGPRFALRAPYCRQVHVDAVSCAAGGEYA